MSESQIKWAQLFCAMLFGASLTLSYAPFSHWFIAPFSLICVFFLFFRFPPKSAFWFGLSFGLGWFGAGISWVHVSIANFGGLPLIGSLGLMLLLCAYLALFPALFFFALDKISKHGFPILLTIASWFLIEWLRSWFLTGFPWLSLGYSQIAGPLAGLMPIIGETGVSALLVFTCLLAGKWLATPSLKAKNIVLAVTSVLMLCIAGYVLDKIEFVHKSERSASVAMVQGNIRQELRWAPEQDMPTMQKYLGLTENYWQNDIIIWPEAAVPRLEPLANSYLTEVDQRAFNENTGLITGIVNYNFESQEAFNNLIVLGKNSDEHQSPQYEYFHANRYAKHHLLPIGEFIPMEKWLRGLAPIFDLPMSSFTRGDYEQNNLLANGYHFLPAICFEIAFPRQVAANLRSHTDFIITVSNDAWFGSSHGPAQHLEIAQVRAKEFGLPVMRATNNGITAFIDEHGNIVERAPQFEDTVIHSTVNTTVGKTPYRLYGDTFMWIISLFSALFIFYRYLKTKLTR